MNALKHMQPNFVHILARPLVMGLIVLLGLVLDVSAANPVVSNVRVSQEAGKKLVNITYNVSDPDSSKLAISIAVSTNDGSSYDLSAPSMSDYGSIKSIGNSVSPGNDRKVAWNAGADWNGQYSSKMRFLVVASDIVADAQETFSYSAGQLLSGKNGEIGWGGAWYENSNLFKCVAESFPPQLHYPPPLGNKLHVVSPEGSNRTELFRPTGKVYCSGRIYVSFIMNYQYYGPYKYAGLSLCRSNTEEKVFFGELWGGDQTLGIESFSFYGAFPSSYLLEAGVENDYIIVGCYDWSAGQACVKAFKIGSQNVPIEEPASWDMVINMPSNYIGVIDTIRLSAGASDGTPGNTYFDEVRIATNWAGLVAAIPP